MIKMRLCFKITMINKHMIIQAFHVFGTVTAVHGVLKIYLSMLYSKQLSTYDLNMTHKILNFKIKFWQVFWSI